ncbi:MAG: ATP-binding cassette domain-containing protein [Oscillospiraceae bacterium]
MLKIKHLKKKFGKKVIFNDFSFDFCEKTTYIIGGNSGEGKTTLLNMLSGYVKPDEGEIINENNRTIEYLFQDELLFSNLTVRDNMLIKYLNLKDDFDEKLFKDNFEVALDNFGILDLSDKKASQLSGGERQRVSLAMIFLSKADIIIMDEPTVKLDRENKENIINLVNKTFKDKTLIIVTHDVWVNENNAKYLHLSNGDVDVLKEYDNE